ncbi:MAG TPA: hypothetical protein DCZ01_03795 [Elusimicrobia bacterium]|nr:MAG: hypothetical protein A2X37_06240 [Elusimicrobia bacterium GWA2_66_18]HAZ07650.1 hypothetical protein [Elusimicrobiota bacterium]
MSFFLPTTTARSIPWRTALAGVLLAISALRLAAVVEEMRGKYVRDDYCMAEVDFNPEGGEALFHGIKGRVSWSMPAYSVANALICQGKSPEEVLSLPAAAIFLCALLVFGIGALLADALTGAVGLAAYAFLSAGPDSFRERWLFTLSVALTAFLLVWRARSPSPAKTVLLAASIGLADPAGKATPAVNSGSLRVASI